jgi:type I restriction enzyme R subunit
MLRESQILVSSISSLAITPVLNDCEDCSLLSGPVAVGTGQDQGPKIELSKLIDLLNERFGRESKPEDKLFLDSIKEDAVGDTNLKQAALANSMENFGYVFQKLLRDFSSIGCRRMKR